MTTLKKALSEDKLEQFLAEREDHPPADHKAFHKTLNSMAGKRKPARETSAQDERDD